MAVMVDKGNSQEFEKPAAGLHSAVCISVVDLGTQENNYQGEISHKRQVALIWELDQTMKEGKFAGERMLVSMICTASLNEKAKLRGILESWRGKSFSEAELTGYDVEGWKGAPCMIKLVLNEKSYAKVSGVMPAMPDKKLEPRKLNYVPQWIKDIANRGDGGQTFDDGTQIASDDAEHDFF